MSSLAPPTGALVRGRLRAYAARCLAPSSERPAAVLVPLFEREGALSCWFIVRSSAAPTHAGQIAFPGGTPLPDESDLVTTALREAHEEIALDPSTVDVVGRLDDCRTVVSGFVIAPVVAFVPAAFAPVPSAREVEEAFALPLADFLAPGAYAPERWSDSRGERSIDAYRVGGRRVWGATARIVHNLLDVLDRDAAAANAGG